MKFGVYLALVGAITATKIAKGTGMSDSNEPVARSSADLKNQSLAQAKHGDSSDEEEEHHKPNPVEEAKVRELGDQTNQPELSYSRSYDHEFYGGGQLRADNSRMTVKITDHRKGPYCSEADWVVGYWKKWNGTDGTKMEDVKEKGDGRPAVFKVGNYQVSKCLDLAAQQMKHGETATITCPQDLDQGGDVQNLYRNQYNGDYYLQNSTPTKYEFTVQECSLRPHYLDLKDDLESLVDGFAFYIKNAKKNKDGEEMCITADPADQYAPRTTGVHNVYLKKCEGKEHPNLLQQWIYKSEENSLKSIGLPGGALFEGFNQNMIVYNWRGLHNQRFRYNIGDKKFTNKFTGNAMDVFGDKLIDFENINTNEPDDTKGQNWLIDYQSEDHGHDHEH